MPRTAARPGYTILELVVVLALLLLLAAAMVPTMSSLYGNTRQKAAADVVLGRLAEARAKAIEDGTPYRLSVSEDGTRVRLAPDTPEAADLPPDDPAGPLSKVTEDTLDRATAQVQPVNADDPPPAVEAGGWVTVATFLPDGTCRELGAVVVVRESTFQPILIHVRGVTGTTKVTTESAGAKP